MDEWDRIIDNEFSTEVIGILNYKLDKISNLILKQMNSREYAVIKDELSLLLVDISKDFFAQGFLRGIATKKVVDVL